MPKWLWVNNPAVGGIRLELLLLLRDEDAVGFLLQMLRMLHTILGITPAKPEHERRYLLLWTVALIMVLLTGIACILLLVPRIMH